MRYAIYRCLYGEDFIQESIKSVIDHVDKVFIFWTNKPWGNTDRCMYKGEEVVFREDQIVKALKDFEEGGYDCATTRQVELWKTAKFRIPYRPSRCGANLWNLGKINKLPSTGTQGNIDGMPVLDVDVHNFGFWLDKWEAWSEDNQSKNLEISLGFEHNIPHAVAYNISDLPSLVVAKYKL